MLVDALTSAPQYRAHLLPLWEALPPVVQGARVDLDAAGSAHRPRRVDRAALVASARDLTMATRLGYSRIALLEHGIGQSYSNGHPSYPGGRGRDAVSLFLSPNATAAGKDRAAYPAARVEVIGDPGLDTLPALSGPPGVVAISFHWSCRVAPESGSAFLHFQSVIGALASVVPLIGHAHPRAAAEMARFYRRAGVEFVSTFEEVCRRASVYACDNSSSIFEFASTGRPVVLLNAPWFRRDVEHGLRFWAAAGVGRQVDQPEELAEVIKCSLTEPPLSTVGPALRLAYSYSTGAAQRGAAILAEWLQTSLE